MGYDSHMTINIDLIMVFAFEHYGHCPRQSISKEKLPSGIEIKEWPEENVF